MEALELARLQFAVTTVYHFFFVPLTLGLSLIVAGMQTQYVRTGNEVYKQMTKFWGNLFIINFAMGVVTGIVQEFQFGMNWSEYSRFVGDVFGAPLAIEALLAFFLESTFLAVWLFGWDRLPKGLHLGSIWLAAIGANLSAFWILVANSFMQHPVGYEIVESGRAQMTDFGALLTNSTVLHQFPHVFFGGLTTGAFFVLGVSAYHFLRKNEEYYDMFRKSVNIALVVGTVGVLATMLAGHASGQEMLNTQPMKLAAAEGLWESEDPAALSLFQIGDEEARESVVNITFPSLLSFLTYNEFDGVVPGLNNLQAQYEAEYGPGDYIPPMIWMTYWSFRAMVGAGTLLFVLGLVGFYLRARGKFITTRWFLLAMMGAIILPYLANSTGWILTEVGRQPWIVYGELTLADALSPNVTTTELWISLIGFTLVYGVLMVVDIGLLWKYGSKVSTEVIGLSLMQDNQEEQSAAAVTY
jgi:cytochrome bd ubiquinol oxidase subunit I